MNARELRAHSGPAFERWRRAVAASVGGVLAEDLLRAEFDDAPGSTAASSAG